MERLFKWVWTKKSNKNRLAKRRATRTNVQWEMSATDALHVSILSSDR